jgi:outer membrane murein-binding lipoprotein Lpp
MEADRLIAVGNLLISLATAIGLVVSTWLLNGKIDKLNSKFDRLTGRVDALETSHTAHVNSGLHAR